MKIPKKCPTEGCEGTQEDFVADYYEAVRQGIVIVDGEVHDYDGTLENYDDGSTENEAIRCVRCWEAVVDYGTFMLIPPEHIEAVSSLITSAGVVE